MFTIRDKPNLSIYPCLQRRNLMMETPPHDTSPGKTVSRTVETKAGQNNVFQVAIRRRREVRTNSTTMHIADVHRLVSTMQTTKVSLVAIIIYICGMRLLACMMVCMNNVLTLLYAHDAKATHGKRRWLFQENRLAWHDYNFAHVNWRREPKYETWSYSTHLKSNLDNRAITTESHTPHRVT